MALITNLVTIKDLNLNKNIEININNILFITQNETDPNKYIINMGVYSFGAGGSSITTDKKGYDLIKDTNNKFNGKNIQ